MGLMRALTLKRSSILPSRTITSPIKGRPQISLPTELISSTNNLSYTAPSVESMQQKAAGSANASASETSSMTSSDIDATAENLECPATPSTVSTSSESDASRRSSHLSTTSGTGTGSAPSLTDASSVSSSPITPFAPQNLLSPQSAYFSTDSFSKPSSRNSTLTFLDDSEIDPLTVVVPALPRRAPSHSKREHERLARRRSQRVSMKPVAVTDVDIEQDILSPAPLSAALALPELREVDEDVVPAVTVVEVASEEESKSLEELLQEMVQQEMVNLQEDEETCYMREHNLKRFSVGGYLDLVGDVWGSEVVMVGGCAIVVA